MNSIPNHTVPEPLRSSGMRETEVKKLMLMLFASLFLVAGVVHARFVTVKANIPFDFVIGSSTLHAGKYTIQPISRGDGTILLRSADLKEAVVMNPFTCASASPQHESELVFKVIGDRYFLYQIWTAGYGAGRELSINPWEIEGAKAASMRTVVIKAASPKG